VAGAVRVGGGEGMVSGWFIRTLGTKGGSSDSACRWPFIFHRMPSVASLRVRVNWRWWVASGGTFGIMVGQSFRMY
jgi:hypothetical protein